MKKLLLLTIAMAGAGFTVQNVIAKATEPNSALIDLYPSLIDLSSKDEQLEADRRAVIAEIQEKQKKENELAASLIQPNDELQKKDAIAALNQVAVRVKRYLMGYDKKYSPPRSPGISVKRMSDTAASAMYFKEIVAVVEEYLKKYDLIETVNTPSSDKKPDASGTM